MTEMGEIRLKPQKLGFEFPLPRNRRQGRFGLTESRLRQGATPAG
jgi:hypothetical protein